jgi:Ca2+/Na+ antiporter
VLSAGLVYGATYGLLRAVKEDAKFQRTAMALAIMGALAALAYIVLHLVFSIALPPPLPTEKLLRFLLFPILIWMVFMYAFLFRHVSLRPVPAFVTASLYVLVIEVILSPICR